MDGPAPHPGPADNQETYAERLDRNWNELLQELRVTQTGVQVLTGFLLTVPFSNRFEDLTVEIPRDTGPDAPRAVWKVDGTVRVTTSDNASGD